MEFERGEIGNESNTKGGGPRDHRGAFYKSRSCVRYFSPDASGSACCGQEAKPQYTMAEYNAYQAAAAEKNPAQQVKALDDFASKYPNSALMIYIYPLYYQAYSQLKNYQKVIEYADKLVALGEKADAGARYQALYARAFAYNAIVTDPALGKTAGADPALAKSAMAAAVAGLKALDEVKKPEAMTDDAFATQKKQIQIYFNGTAAQAAMVQKDNASAIQYYKAVLELNPDDAITSYRLGLAYMAMTPPQQMDAFWSIARAVTAKGRHASAIHQSKRLSAQADSELPAGRLRQSHRCGIERTAATRRQFSNPSRQLQIAERGRSHGRAQRHDHAFGD